MVAQVGCDPFGAALKTSLADAGVDISRIGTCGRATGTATISVLPDGENAIVISPGANSALDPQTALGRLAELCAGDFLLTQLEIPLETVHAALAEAKAKSAVTMLDPAPASPLLPELLRLVDYLTPNQSEAAAILGDPNRVIRDFGDAEAAGRALLDLGPRTVVMKLGSLGCLIAARDGVTPVPGYRVTAVDTTAAGDVFNGAFAVALAEGRTVAAAAAFANAAAAISVGRHGAQSSVPTRAEVDAFPG
jgi:ribokinase